MPIRIRNGTLDTPSLWASETANAISPSANPISRMTLSIRSLLTSFDQQALERIDRTPIPRDNQRRTCVENCVSFRVSALRLVRFDNRDNRRPGACTDLELANRHADARRAWFNREPLEDQIFEDNLGYRQTARHVSQSADDARDLSRLTVSQLQDRRRSIRVAPCEVVQLTCAIVVNDYHQSIAACRLNLKFAAYAGKNCFADGRHEP